MPGVFRPSLRILDHALSALFQPVCILCERLTWASSICPDCVPIYPLHGHLCSRCGDVLPQPTSFCGACLPRRKFRISRIRSLLWLDESSKKILHKIKYAGRFEHLSLFKRAFEVQFDPFFPKDTCLIPVPMHFSKFLDRGFNQSEILAEWMHRLLGVPLLEDGLRKIKKTAPQSLLSQKRRLKNLHQSFQWNPKIRPPPKVLLIDDVYTTGSTLEVCARELKRAGVKEIYAWTLFRTPKS